MKIVDLATRWTRTSMAADRSILFAPQTDLALANAVCHEIVKNGWVNQAFVDKHVSFHEGKTGIGYGLEDGFSFKDEAKTIAFARYRELLEDYSPDKVERLSGVPAREIRYLASLYGDPARKVMSFWRHGIQPAHPGDLDQQPRLQHRSPHREDRHAGKQPVLAHRAAERLRHRAGGGHPHQPPARTARSPARRTGSWPPRSGGFRWSASRPSRPTRPSRCSGPSTGATSASSGSR